MKPQQTERLVGELTRDLRPVRRLPRLRVVAAVAALLGGSAGLMALAAAGVRPDLGSLCTGSFGFLAILLGLAFTGLGGAAAALGASVPGRERLERAGLAVLAAALLLGVVLAPGALWLAGSLGAAPPLARDLDCLIGAARIALAPGAVLLWFVARGAPQNPARTLGLAAAAAVGLGALVMQASCPFASARHLILGHALAPLFAALLLALPLGWLWRRRGAGV